MSTSARWRSSLAQRQRDAAVALRELLRVRERAVGDQQALDLRLREMARDQFDGFAGADQQHRRIVEAARTIPRQPHRGRRHRHRIGADAGVGARALGGDEGLLEQAVELPAQRARAARRAPGLLHLAEDLRFAEHQRIQPGGDAEQVAHGVGVRCR